MTIKSEPESIDHVIKPGTRYRPVRLIEPLTERELEVLRQLCNGASNQEIGIHLCITVSTVKWHLLQIFGKLGVERRMQAVVAAIHLKVVEPTWLLAPTRPIN